MYKTDFKKLLQESYIEYNLKNNMDTSQLEFIGENIFGLTTYESEIMEDLTVKCLKTCKAITNRKTFDFVAENEMDYITAINFSFFENKLDWGTSIRGAWWDFADNDFFYINSFELWYDGEQITNLKINKTEWSEFIYALCEFTVIE